MGPPHAKKQRLDPAATDCHEIKINSSALMSASDVFAQMLQSNMVEQTQKRIEITAKSVKDVEDLTFYINTNKLHRRANPRTLAPLAHLYQIHDLFWRCINMMVNQLDVENIVEVFQIFNKY